VLILAIGYEWHVRQSRDLAGQISVDQAYQNRVTALVSDALEYSKKNPGIDPILQSIGAKPGAAAAPMGKTGNRNYERTESTDALAAPVASVETLQQELDSLQI